MTMPTPATVADLVRLEDQLDEALRNMLNKPANPSTIADLKRRKDALRDEIAWLSARSRGGWARPALTLTSVAKNRPRNDRASAAANPSGSRGADRR